MRTLVWFRGKDLRVSDHAPLRAAVTGGEVIPVFVLDPYFFAPERATQLSHRMQFLLASLRELEGAISKRGSRLVCVAGKSCEVIPQLVERWKVDRVVAHRWVEPFARERDRRIASALGDKLALYEGETLLAPGSLRSGSGKPYAVFTYFARAFGRVATVGQALAAPRSLPPLPQLDGLTALEVAIPRCEALGITPNPRILAGGEAAGRRRLRRFLQEGGAARCYDLQRDRMDEDGTSRLSADLKFGTVSVRQLRNAVARAVGDSAAGQCFMRQLIWREFAHSSLWDRPELLSEPFRPGFADFPWIDDARGWQAWTEGRTGYPVVDAAARQLLGEGFVHNRARMIAASFVTKHLVIDYRRGEAHYLRYLTDGDWAQNNLGWQWSAGCGCDAQPYFRIFNPVVQGRKFDPQGNYVRRWVPELARMPARHVHAPWEAPEQVLDAAGVTLDDSYPGPIVDHRYARDHYLALADEHLKRS